MAAQRVLMKSRTYQSIEDSDIRDQLARYRENVVVPQCPFVPRKDGILRRRMIDEILRFKPKNEREFRRLLPRYLVRETNQKQIELYATEICGIVNRAVSDRGRRVFQKTIER